MQENIKNKETKKSFKMKDLSPDDRQKLVGAFAWLIQEYKKQNPASYQDNEKEND